MWALRTAIGFQSIILKISIVKRIVLKTGGKSPRPF
jgi:hypothetical protein